MNPALDRLYAYPFERLRVLLEGIAPGDARPIDLGIGEPQHPTPRVLLEALRRAESHLGKYPPTAGSPELKQAIADWHARRYGITLDPNRQILPVSGTREALFGFAQAVVDPSTRPVVLLPNPFYQIYEGAATLAGAEPFYVPTPAENGFLPDWTAIPGDVWPRVQLAYVCSPGNPAGAVLDEARWAEVFSLADRYGFLIAADECYSEIYRDRPPVGALQAAQILGRGDERIVAFNSLSKRSSAPGLRSGFVAGDPAVVAKYLLYRTYHGAAPAGMVQAASAAAWSDEIHVEESRAKYRAKFADVHPVVSSVLPCQNPEGGFFLWARVPESSRWGGDDAAFARDLWAETGVKVLPGSYLARETSAGNPGAGFVRIALVAEVAVCREAAERLARFAA